MRLFFDGMIFSAELGIRKPDTAFFKAALARFGVSAEETLFIDDLPENVAEATACGIEGLIFCGDAEEAKQFIYQKR